MDVSCSGSVLWPSLHLVDNQPPRITHREELPPQEEHGRCHLAHPHGVGAAHLASEVDGKRIVC